MSFEDKVSQWFGRPELTKTRIWLAFVVAAFTDAAQFGLGPLGWVFADEAFDVLAMVLISRAIGFHLLLLPTFLIEFMPGPDMLPTWTACTAAVIILRKRAQSSVPPPIDIAGEVTPVPDAEPVNSPPQKPTGSPQPSAIPPKI